MSAILGYCLVLWSGLTRITIDYVSPDILVTAFIFCISGVLLQLRARQVTSATFILLGFLLGVAYLTKGIFFLLAIAFYIPASLLSLNVYAARKSALVLVAFLVTCAPFVTALSVRKGRLTFGETGRLNYAWEVLGAPRSTHWQGEPENLGAPTHPTIQVLDSPAAFVFPEPIAGTYPPWYDPSYWYDGISPRFNLGRQVDVLKKNLYYSLIQIVSTPGAITLLILVLGNVLPRWLASHAISRYWFLLLPSAGAILSYCLVFVDRRYISGFLVVFVMAIWAAVCERLGHLRWPARAVIVSAVVFAGAFLFRGDVVGLSALRTAFASGFQTSNPQWEIAQGAESAGMDSGEKVGYIGLAMSADWLRLRNHRVVGEVTVQYDRDMWPAQRIVLNTAQIHKFWLSEQSSQEALFASFRDAGARWVAADYVPSWANTSGWCQIGGHGVDTTFIRSLTDQECVDPSDPSASQ